MGSAVGRKICGGVFLKKLKIFVDEMVFSTKLVFSFRVREVF